MQGRSERQQPPVPVFAHRFAEGRDAVQGLRASTVETNDLASAVRISEKSEKLTGKGTDFKETAVKETTTKS